MLTPVFSTSLDSYSPCLSLQRHTVLVKSQDSGSRGLKGLLRAVLGIDVNSRCFHVPMVGYVHLCPNVGGLYKSVLEESVNVCYKLKHQQRRTGVKQEDVDLASWKTFLSSDMYKVLNQIIYVFNTELSGLLSDLNSHMTLKTQEQLLHPFNSGKNQGLSLKAYADSHNWLSSRAGISTQVFLSAGAITIHYTAYISCPEGWSRRGYVLKMMFGNQGSSVELNKFGGIMKEKKSESSGFQRETIL